MQISGRSLQFNIDSAISFQFRAGFTSTYYAGQRPEKQLKSHHEEELARSKNLGIEGEWREEVPLYEVVGPCSNESAASTRRAAPGTIALPARASEEATLVSAELLSRDHYAAEAYQELANRQTAYVHSYNQNGQRVFATTESSTIDLVI